MGTTRSPGIPWTGARGAVLGLTILVVAGGCGDGGRGDGTPASGHNSRASMDDASLQTVLDDLLSGAETRRTTAVASLPAYGAEGVAALGARLRVSMDEDEITALSQALLSLGPIADAAVPDLIVALWGADRNGQYAAQDALAKFGEPAARALTAALDAEPHRAVLAAITLYRFPAFPGVCVPALVHALDSPDEGVRHSAAGALKVFKEHATPATPRLIELLEDTEVMWTASESLAQIGPSAVPALTEALDAGGKWSKVFGAKALAGIGPPALAAVPALLRLQRDPMSGVRTSALEALACILPAADAVPRLLAALRETGNPGLQGAAAESLRALGPAAAGAVPELRAAMRAGDWYVRLRAAHAVLVIDVSDTEGIDVLAGALGSRSSFDQGEAADRLGSLGARAVSAVPALRAYVAAGCDGTSCVHATRALADIQSHADEK